MNTYAIFWTSVALTLISIILQVCAIYIIEKYRQEYLKRPTWSIYRVGQHDYKDQIDKILSAIEDNYKANEQNDKKRSSAVTFIIFGNIAAFIAMFFNSILYYQS